jgi:hypothetical protein
MNTNDRLHNAIVTATHEIRNRLGAADVGSFSFTIETSGRTMTDTSEVKIEYRVSAGWDCSVKGDELEACIVEVLRRKGWDDRHAPLALPPTPSCK